MNKEEEVALAVEIERAHTTSPTGVNPWGWFVGRDGMCYNLCDVFEVNALPGKIDERGIIVPYRKEVIPMAKMNMPGGAMMPPAGKKPCKGKGSKKK